MQFNYRMRYIPLVGAGATSGGSMGCCKSIENSLARGELQCIGATTYSEYRNHLDKDKLSLGDFLNRYWRASIEIGKGLTRCPGGLGAPRYF